MLEFFLWLHWGYRFWGSRVPFPLHHGKVTYHHNLWLLMVALITWLRVRLSGFLPGVIPHPTRHLRKNITMGSSHLRSGEFCSISFRVGYLYNYLEFCMGVISLLSQLLIYWTIYLYPCGLIYISFNFELCSNIVVQSSLSYGSNFSTFVLWELFQLTPMFFWHTPVNVGFFFEAYFYLHFWVLFIGKKDHHVLISISLLLELNFHKYIGLLWFAYSPTF